MNLPNALTLLRIFIVPLLVVVLLTPFAENWVGVPRHILGVTLFLGAALTDYLDGQLARRRDQVTRLGQLLDPIADKLLISAALISLVENQLAPAWAVVIIIGREFAVTGFVRSLLLRGCDLQLPKWESLRCCAGSYGGVVNCLERGWEAAASFKLWPTVSGDRILVCTGTACGFPAFVWGGRHDERRLAGLVICRWKGNVMAGGSVCVSFYVRLFSVLLSVGSFLRTRKTCG